MRGAKPYLIGCGGLLVLATVAIALVVVPFVRPFFGVAGSMKTAAIAVQRRCPQALALQQKLGAERSGAARSDPATARTIYAAYLPCIRDAAGADRAALDLFAATALAPAAAGAGTAADLQAMRDVLADGRRNAAGDRGLLQMISLMELGARRPGSRR